MAAGESFNPSVFEEILERISEGEPLRVICREEGMPCFRVVYKKREEDKEYDARFARARLLGFDAIAEECREIADDGRNDWMLKKMKDEEFTPVLDHEHVQRSKLRVETRLKLLAKWDPKRYGEKVTNELTGPDGGPLDHKWQIEFVNPTRPREKARQTQPTEDNGD